MGTHRPNLFKMPPEIAAALQAGEELSEEYVEALLPDHGVLIERIISTGQASPEGFWYDQERDEWVVLLQGEARLSWPDGRILEMKAGEWVFLPDHERHRVEWTTKEPPCIWLAVQGRIK